MFHEDMGEIKNPGTIYVFTSLTSYVFTSLTSSNP